MDAKSISLKMTGKNLKMLREKKGYSVANVCAQLGDITPQTVYKWERGVSIPGIDNLILLSELYGVTINDMVVVG